MFRIQNPAGDWLKPVNGWYHGNPTFTTVLANSGTFTEAQADEFLLLPKMHPGSFKVPVEE